MATLTGRDLINQINNLTVPPGALALWALGQSGFVLKGGDVVAYVDPYLSVSADLARRFPPPVQAEHVSHAHVVFCTHEHIDHTDRDTVEALAKASPQAIFVGPTYSRDILRQAHIPDARILVPKVDEWQSAGGLTFSAVPSAHYGLDYDPERGYRWLGFVIQLNGVTLYHSGDTILYPGLLERLKPYAIDIACLPVNGRDGWREQQGLIGNLDMREAAQLAVTIGADVLIPMHNDLFAGNRVSPVTLAEYLDQHAPAQKYHWLQPGELYFYVK